MAHLEEGGHVETYGPTTLTNGQLKVLVNTSNNLIARILDKGDVWHCFFQNYKGLKGEETGPWGAIPHIHYISNAFGVSRDELVKMLKEGHYPTTPVHIPVTDLSK